MAELITASNMQAPDEFYQQLNSLYQALDDDQSRDVNARLILLLSNHIGDQQVLSQALKIAGEHVKD
ncbi:DUF2783 domain-containing protein [Amphritea balenae]|uniref:DUF2783 domain-containing protein n=1 Tax=Amphritea balenae TaxID=452629 RepID=A0A3P1SU03_9GAMM|nr:DUF2783 domain-containing protein [Amphritea balenae]RRD00694.1 DUF2783 domain-containing protein [Amphritea balenae]GGK68652.1 hypothetical protein GCM10007941_18490 [Amphritea balenae]